MFIYLHYFVQLSQMPDKEVRIDYPFLMATAVHDTPVLGSMRKDLVPRGLNQQGDRPETKRNK